MQTMAELLAPPSSAVATTLATDVVEFRRLPVAILRAVHTVCMDDRQRQQDFLSGQVDLLVALVLRQRSLRWWLMDWSCSMSLLDSGYVVTK